MLIKKIETIVYITLQNLRRQVMWLTINIPDDRKLYKNYLGKVATFEELQGLGKGWRLYFHPFDARGTYKVAHIWNNSIRRMSKKFMRLAHSLEYRHPRPSLIPPQSEVD